MVSTVVQSINWSIPILRGIKQCQYGSVHTQVYAALTLRDQEIIQGDQGPERMKLAGRFFSEVFLHVTLQAKWLCL